MILWSPFDTIAIISIKISPETMYVWFIIFSYLPIANMLTL